MENQTLEPAAHVEPVHIELGYGRVEIGQGHHGPERLPAILFGKNGAGEVGIETEGDRIMEPGECIVAITFRNRASLEVVAEKIDELRERIWPEIESGTHIRTWRERVSDEDGQLSCFNACLAENSSLRAYVSRMELNFLNRWLQMTDDPVALSDAMEARRKILTYKSFGSE